MRRTLDQYFTPEAATFALLAQHPSIGGRILEPCSGNNDMANVLALAGNVWTNDIDPQMPSRSHVDASDPAVWDTFLGPAPTMRRPDWVISNPPFSCCHSIIEGAFRVARKGVAMLLRLSYLEPCNNRAEFLAKYPPSLIVLPRISFTGDGKTDNVTCAWCVWEFPYTAEQYVKIVSKHQLHYLMSTFKPFAEAHPRNTRVGQTLT